MSDLLPLVAAALNDKVAFETYEEIIELRKQLDLARSVEIIRAVDNEDEDEQVLVYASAQFQDGQYGDNPNLWQVDLGAKGEMHCRLADLRGCRICVGGGISLESLDDQTGNRAVYEGFLDRSEFDSDNSKTVWFCFCPNSLWLAVVVHGWPRSEWEAVLDEADPSDMIRFLVETVAAEHPEATVEFKEISFVKKHIDGALKRLLPPKRKEEVRAAREMDDSKPLADLYCFVASTMRDRGNQSGYVQFASQVDDIMSMLIHNLGISELNEHTEAEITRLIEAYEIIGRDGMEEVSRQLAETNDEEETEEDGEE